MIRAGVFSNGIEGLETLYASNERIQYLPIPITAHFNPDLSPYDLVIAPNGTDHVAMYRVRHLIQDFLNDGKTLFCFDGWFTNWIPGNRWVMDNTKKSMDVRYQIADAGAALKTYFQPEALSFSHGISGWWACGYIQPAPGAEVLLTDTWDRPLLVHDRVSTAGQMILSASAPLGDASYATTDDRKAHGAMSGLYAGLLDLIYSPHPLAHD